MLDPAQSFVAGRLSRILVHLSCALAGFIGLVVLSGWLLNVQVLKSVTPGLPNMKANTAIGLCLLAAAAWLARTPARFNRYRAAIWILAGVACLLAAITLSEYAFNWDAGIDQLLFQDVGHVSTAYPHGRMAPATGACFLLLSAAILVLDALPRFSQFFTLAAAFVTLVALIGYVYDLPTLYGAGRYTSVALHTIIGLLALCLSILAARPARGVIGLVAASRSERSSLLLLFAGALVFPIAVGSAALHGQRFGWYGAEFSLALCSVLLIVLTTTLVWLTASDRERANDRRIHAEQSLRASEERLRIAIQSGAIGTWDADPVTGHRNWDARCKAIFGFPPDFPLDTERIHACIHPDDRELVKLALREYVDPSGDGRLELQHRVISWNDGSMHYVYSQGRTHFEGEGTARRAVRSFGIMQDITLMKEREHALIHLNDQLEQFAYAAAHDLQEPLRNVSLSTQLVAQRYGHVFDSKAQDLVKTAIKGSLLMEAMVKDLLAYSRALSSEPGTSTIADSDAVLTLALQNLAAAIEQKQASVLTHPLPPVRMPAVHLLQVLQNLIGNSLKYSQVDRPVIDVSSVDRNGLQTFSVRDNGIGIDPRYHDRAFGVFKRLHDRDIPGTGIGLALCKRVVEHYGGKIWIESESGQGTAVLFTLQLAEGRKRPTE